MDFHSLTRKDLQFLCKKNRIPANLTNVAMAKALEALQIVEGIEEIQETLKVTTMASKEEEIQENLGFQSLNIKSPENSRTCRRTSALKPSASHRSRQAASKDSEVIDMTYKEEGEKKEVPHIFPKTPATRKPMKGVEGQSSRRRYKKNEEVENHTETPKAVEAVVGKGIGVVTRRSTRLSSRKAFEDSVTRQSNGRRSSREHSAVTMKVLGENDRADQEKKEEKKDVDEYGDSYAVVVEESGKKNQEVEIHEISSDDDEVDDSNNEVENECEAAHENVPVIQQQQPSPHRRCTRATAKALETSKIVSKKKKDGRKAPKLLPNTRRNTRLSSRIPLEKKSKEEEAVKTEDLTEENAEEQVKEDENKDHAEKSDSCIVDPVEEDKEKGKKEESHGYSIVALVEEANEKDQEVEIHGFSSSSQEDGREEGAVKMVDLTEENAEEQEKEDENKVQSETSDSCIVDPVEEEEEKDKKEESHSCSFVSLVDEVKENDQEVESHGFSSSSHEDGREEGFSSSIHEDGREDEAVKKVDLTEESSEEKEKGDENKDQAEKSDSCIVALIEEDEENDKKEETHGRSIVALVEEVKEKDQEVESHGFSSSTQEDNSNYLVENGDSTVVHAEEDQNNCIVAPVEEAEEKDKKEESHGCSIAELIEEFKEKDQEVESHGFSSSTQEDGSNYSVKNGDSTVVLPEEDQNNDQEPEIQVLSSSIGRDNSNVEPFESAEESSDQPPVNEYVKDSSENSPENEHVKDCGDHSSENGLVDDFNNQGSKFVGVSGVLFQANEEPSSDTKLAISAVSDNLHCSETSPLPHEEAIVCTQESSVILEEEENLSLLFTKMTLDEAEESGNTLLDPVAAQEVVSKTMGETREEVEESLSFLAGKIPAAIEESIDDDLSDVGKLTINDSVDVQGTCFEPQIMVSSTELCTEFSAASESTMEVKESSGEIPTDLPAVIKESFEDNLTDSRELAANGFVNVLQKAETPVSSSEHCSEFSTVDSTIKSISVDQLEESVEDKETEIFQGASFELCSEASIADSAIEFKEASGDLPSEISAVIGESVEAGFPNLDEHSYEKSVDMEICQDVSFEPRIPVPSTPKLSFNFSATTLATISSPLKLPCDAETTPLKSSIVQTQSSSTALEKEVFLKERNLELLSLTKLRAILKQKLIGTKAEEGKKSTIKQEELESLSRSSIKHEQKMNVDMKLEAKKSPEIKQEESRCLSRSSKLDSNCKQKINNDMIKLDQRKRTPLKSLNYSTF